MLTSASGTACFISAQTPATCGAAIDVPLSASYPPPVTDDVIESPGAHSDMNVAAFENHATWSCLSVAPTLTADEMHAGAESPNGQPSLPAATTVATPIARRLSMIGLYGWSSHGASKMSAPRLMFTDATW